MNSDSDIKLVEAAQHGCIESFGALYEQYYCSIAALAFSILNDRQLAEDAAQETFAAACGQIRNLKNKEKFASWLAGICRNVSRQILRKNKIHHTVTNEAASTQIEGNEQSRTVIKQALNNLKESERELIVMRYFDNLPYGKIASVLDISEQAVHGRLVRTKRKIAKYLKNNGETGDSHE